MRRERQRQAEVGDGDGPPLLPPRPPPNQGVFPAEGDAARDEWAILR